MAAASLHCRLAAIRCCRRCLLLRPPHLALPRLTSLLPLPRAATTATAATDDIYADVCLSSQPAKLARQLALMLSDHPAGISSRPVIAGAQPSSLRAPGNDYDPCIDSEAEAYLNRPDVQHALHANTSGQVAGPWADCSPRLRYLRRDLLVPMLPVYRRLLRRGGLRMLVFSGDVDAIVPGGWGRGGRAGGVEGQAGAGRGRGGGG